MEGRNGKHEDKDQQESKFREGNETPTCPKYEISEKASTVSGSEQAKQWKREQCKINKTNRSINQIKSEGGKWRAVGS